MQALRPQSLSWPIPKSWPIPYSPTHLEFDPCFVKKQNISNTVSPAAAVLLTNVNSYYRSPSQAVTTGGLHGPGLPGRFHGPGPGPGILCDALDGRTDKAREELLLTNSVLFTALALARPSLLLCLLRLWFNPNLDRNPGAEPGLGCKREYRQYRPGLTREADRTGPFLVAGLGEHSRLAGTFSRSPSSTYVPSRHTGRNPVPLQTQAPFKTC